MNLDRTKRMNEMVLLEEDWAKKIILSSDPIQKLKEFPLFENYYLLTRLEYYSLFSCDVHDSHKNFLFIGGGPFPISAILLTLNYNVNVTVLDLNKNSLEIAKALIERFNLQDRIFFENSSAENFDKYDLFEVIIIAAMVGQDEYEKSVVFDKIYSKSNFGTHILARTSDSHIYPKLNKKVYGNFNPILHVRPLQKVRNSFFVFKK